MSGAWRTRTVRHVAPALVAAVGAGLFVLLGSRVVYDLDRVAFDAALRQTAPPEPSPHVVIVAVDEAALAAHGQWPWPRDLIARLVRGIAERGADVVAFDVLFPEPDRMGLAGAVVDDATSTDAALAVAMSEVPVVAGFALTFEGPAAADVRCGAPTEPIVRQRSASLTARIFQAQRAICNVPALVRAAASAGMINVSPDDDGTLRRIPALAASPHGLHLSLGLAAAATARRVTAVVDEQPDGTMTIAAGGPPLALDDHGQLLLRPRGRGHAFPYVSAADVLAGTTPANAFRDAIVFVGATALGVRDTVATPLDPRFPGVELHATVADTALTGVGATRPPTGRALEVGGAMLAAALAALAVSITGLAGGLVVAGAASLGALGLARTGFAATGGFVSPVGAVAGAALGVATATAAELARQRQRAFRERQRRQQAQRLIVQTLTSLTETRDADTGRHARRTQEYTRLVASTLAAGGRHRDVLTPHRIELLSTLAPLHDIGKVGISDAVLHKPGQLTADEFTEMKRHAELGHDTLSKAERAAGVEDDEVLAIAKDIVLTHHERWDGSGYPHGLLGEAIPLAGRIVAVVDTYDALVAERPYKAALSHDAAIDIIRAGRGSHFDPDVVDAFLVCHADIRRAAREADPTLAPPAVR